MPYIDPKLRAALWDKLESPIDAGQLNFVLTEIIKDYWEQNKKYQTINDIVGALEGAKLEFYRRVAIPYEDSKIKSNGDVY